MSDHDAFAHDLAALHDGRAFVDLSAWRTVRVFGDDAVSWLHDLLTADIAGLTPGAACRSLLLTPTGRIRADVQVMRRDDDVVLAQAPDQPHHIGSLLSPYLLSSRVSLEDATTALDLFAVPEPGAARVDHPGHRPSALGPGIDLLVPTGTSASRAEAALVQADLLEVGPDAADAWRVLLGIPRMGSDFGQDALPSEVGLEHTIDTAKGCFLGQESVARVRNLGHPPRILRRVRADVKMRAGTPVLVGSTPVGSVTSVAPTDGGSVAFALVRWAADASALAQPDGTVLLVAD